MSNDDLKFKTHQGRFFFILFFYNDNSKSILMKVTGNRRDLAFKSVQILRAYFTHIYLFIYFFTDLHYLVYAPIRDQTRPDCSVEYRF